MEHPAVMECSVVGVADPLRGQAIKAYVVLSPDYTESKELKTEIRNFCNARLAEYNSEAARFERLRSERDRRLAATDYLLMSDYPLNDTLKGAVQTYRQALRDLPSQEGAPWDGGGEETPWPEIPTWVKA